MQRNPVESNSGKPPKCDYSPVVADANNTRQQEAKPPVHMYGKNIVHANSDCLPLDCALPSNEQGDLLRLKNLTRKMERT